MRRVKKIVTIQYPMYITETGEWWDKPNSEILQEYVDNPELAAFDLSFEEVPVVVIAVNDSDDVESEKPDGDSTGEIDGPTGLYEVPC